VWLLAGYHHQRAFTAQQVFNVRCAVVRALGGYLRHKVGMQVGNGYAGGNALAALHRLPHCLVIAGAWVVGCVCCQFYFGVLHGVYLLGWFGLVWWVRPCPQPQRQYMRMHWQWQANVYTVFAYALDTYNKLILAKFGGMC